MRTQFNEKIEEKHLSLPQHTDRGKSWAFLLMNMFGIL